MPLLLWGSLAFAQLNETFNDDNLTNSPTWSGSNSASDFIVVNKQLRSNSTTASSDFYLSTSNSLAASCQWEFWVNLQFNPSSANYVDVYLTSDQQNLQGSNINGYFVRIGNTADEICLYKRTGATSSATKIIDGTDGILNTSNNKIKIRVIRTAANTFTLERDITGLGTSFVTEGTVVDGTFSTSAFFGVYIKQSTSSFFQKHFFDDLTISPIITDTAPPKVLSASALDSATLEIIFDEALDSVSAKTSANYFMNNGYANPVSIRTTPDASKYVLTFSKRFNTASYILTISNVTDKAGNAISSNNIATFSYIKPYVPKKGDIVINEIFADPSPQIDLPSVEFIEIYNASNESISLKDWKYSDPVSISVLPADSIAAGHYLVLCAKADTSEFKRFGKAIGISPWPSLNNSSDIIKLSSPENITIDSVAYSDSWYSTAMKKQGGWSLERINYKSQCLGLFNWTASRDSSGGTPGKQNSVFIENYDQQNFMADSIIKSSDSTINVFFNKPADIASSTNSIVISPTSGTIQSMLFDTNAKQATVLFSNKFSENTTYQINITQLRDCAGNTILPSSFQFTTPKLPSPRIDTAKIYITEIFADPSPEIKLPLVEYIEIYNPGRDTINLDDWAFTDPTAKAPIKGSILPKEYVILCPIADTLQYQSLGKTIGLSPWPSLNNVSDQITLKSFKGRLVDSVSYQDFWHTSTGKKSGGWSLERIDFASRCAGRFNWASSIDNSGGTPGKRNSINIENFDQLAFKTDSIKKQSDSTVTVYLNKPAADVSVAINSFALNPASTNIKSVLNDLNTKQLTLLFNNSFLPDTNYQLTVSNLKDCAGNSIAPNTSLVFSTPKLPPVRVDTAKLFITEIFADPSPEVKLPLAEFIEIYNPGKDTIDLDGWTLHASSVKSTLRKACILPNEYLVLCPAADSAQYKSLGKTIGISPWSTLTNASGTVFIKSFKGRLIDSISYSDTWHSSISKKQGGWSLERVDYTSVCSGLFNWSTSIDTSGGTPGKINSVALKDYDKIPFKADSIKKLSDSTVTVYFNKPFEVSAAVNSFTLTPASTNLKSVLAGLSTKQVTLLFNNSFLPNTNYQLTISNLKDCAGNNITPNTSLVFSTPKLPPVRVDTAKLFITEIFADPSPEVKLPLAEFIEIYNPGKDTIDLDGWTLHASSAKSTLRKACILPNGYLVICPAADSAQYKSLGKTIGISPWPTLTNASGTVFIKSFKERLIDSIAYSDTWHSSTSKKQGGWSLERIDYTSVCSGLFNWKSSIDTSGGTPGKLNSVALKNYDKIPFKADSIQQLSDTSINIYFNKHVDILTATNAFSLNQGASEKSLVFDSRALKATFTCNEKLKPNTTYFLAIEQLKDCAGNPIETTKFSFTTPKAPPVRLDTAILYITEIFADPSPEVQLPLAEFVEIYNPGKNIVDLDGWILSDQSTRSIIKKAFILPQQHIILCSAADTTQYRSFGKTIGLSPWPSLNNTSEQLTLKSHTGRLADSVSYKDTWYKSDKKRNGGWSLERISLHSFCTEAQNWMASNDTSGGTPGRQNSVHQIFKNSALSVLEAKLVDSVSILIMFNRPPDSTTASNPLNYSVNNGIGLPEKVVSVTETEFELKWKTPITRGNNYVVKSTGITDCQGSTISPTHNTAGFYYPHRIMKNDILISELLFNPRTGGNDFVEIYNNSKNTLDLKELTIATIKVPDSITSKKNLSINTFLLAPDQYLVLSTDPDNVKANYHTENPQAFLKVSSLPAFNSDKGSVVILSGESRIDQFDYSEKMHFALIKDAKGISLERSDFNRPTNEVGNFRSAAASVGFATPGYRNSQFIETNFPGAEEIVLTSKTFSPDNDGFEDALQINYHFKEAGIVANTSIYDDKGMLIKRLTRNTTLASEGTLTWDGVNESGQRAPIGIYIVYFEGFSLGGQTIKFRKPCVLAAKFH